MSIFKTLFKDTFIYGLAMVLPKLVNLLLNGLYTGSLAPDEYSEITSFYVYAGFINVFLTYGMETAFFRFYNKSKNKALVFSTALISLMVSLFLFLVLVYVFKTPIAEKFKVSEFVLLMMIGVVSFDILAVIPFAYYRAKGKALNYFGIRVFTLVVVNGLLNVFFLSWVDNYQIALPEILIFDDLETYVFVANFVANALMMILIVPMYLKFPWKFDRTIFNTMRKYGAPILMAGIAFLVIENLDKLILRDMLGKEAMGAYSACYKFGIFLMLFIQAFRMGIEPFFFSQSAKKNAKESYALVLKFFVIFASLGILMVLSFQDLFARIIIKNDDFLIAIEIVPIILIANWCLGVYQSLSVWYKVTDNTRFGMYFTIIGAIITIALNYWLIPKIGFIAAAYATLIAYATMMILSYVMGRSYYKIPYKIATMFSYLLVALSLTVVTRYLYPENYTFKFVAILVYLAFVIALEKESLKRLLVAS